MSELSNMSTKSLIEEITNVIAIYESDNRLKVESVFYYSTSAIDGGRPRIEVKVIGSIPSIGVVQAPSR